MRRLSLTLMLVVVLSIVGAGWAVDRLFAVLDTRSSDAIQTAEQLGNRLVDLLDGSSQAKLDALAPTDSSEHDIYTIARDSIVLPATLEKQLESRQAVALESVEGVSLHFLLPAAQRVLVLRIPTPGSSATPLRLMLTLTFYLAITLLILIWLYPLIRRLQRLSVAARLIGEGDLSQRIATTARSQLHGIESEFNAMAHRIQMLLDDNRMLSSAVSHDLRTPLSRLRFGVDALEETMLDQKQQDYLWRISEDLLRMEQLVNVLLEFAKLEQKLDDLPLESVCLRFIVEQAKDAVTLTSERRIEDEEIAAGASILADQRYTLMLVNNLLQNAVKFSNSVVRLTISSQGTRVLLYIEDDGPGFNTGDTERLLKPFQKGVREQDAQSAAAGYGLGLAIVERIARWQRATITLGNSVDLKGACVIVDFEAV